jgi:hypothetical protein
MKTSRAVFSQVQQKAGAFPFNIRVLEDEKRARMGLQEAVQHGLVRPYDVQYVYTFIAISMSPNNCQIHSCRYLCRSFPFHHRHLAQRTDSDQPSPSVVQVWPRQDGEGAGR